MTNQWESEALDMLACEFAARPRGAPTILDILPAVRRVERGPHSLRVVFDATSALMVADCVAAEQRCCKSLYWELEREPVLRLTIRAAAAQLDLLEQIFEGSDPDHSSSGFN